MSSVGSHPLLGRSVIGPIDLLSEEGIEIPLPKTLLSHWSMNLLKNEGAKGAVSIIFCSDRYIRDLNHKFRNKNCTTDVLSFPWTDEGSLLEQDSVLGELYISTAQVERQAPRFGTTFEEEMQRVVIHGLLHLCGYNHISSADRLKMRKKEKEYLSRDPYCELSP